MAYRTSLRNGFVIALVIASLTLAPVCNLYGKMFLSTVTSQTSLRREFQRCRAVFLGTAKEVQFQEVAPGKVARVVTLEVHKSWKGADDPNAQLRLRPDSSKAWFEVGQSYLVWAGSLGGQPHNPAVDSVVRVTKLNEASFDLHFLQRLDDPGGIGRLHVSIDEKDVPVATSSVELVPCFGTGCSDDPFSPTETRQLSPTVEVHDFGDLPTPGRYQVRVWLPHSLDPDPFVSFVEMADNDYVELRFSPHPGGRIEGSLLDASGQPAEGLTVHGSRLKGSQRLTCEAVVGAHGQFVLHHCEPGKYRLNLSKSKFFLQREYYYPGSFDFEQATVLEVEPGGVSELQEWRLPAKLEPLTVRGIVVMPDGSPGKGVSVETITLGGRAVKTEETGHFKLKTYVGQSAIEIAARHEAEIDGRLEYLVGTATYDSLGPDEPVIIRLKRLLDHVSRGAEQERE